MNRAVIFLNGNKSDFSRIAEYIGDKTWLIGCDGGTGNMTKLGYKPHAVIGDFDSQDKHFLDESVEIIEHPQDKDYTDSEAAIRYAINKGAKEIILAGLLGDRVDHLLGNVYLLDKRAFKKARIKIIEGNQEIYTITGKTVISGQKGDIISFLPINHRTAKTLRSSGLKYDLSEYELSFQGNSGISNELTADKAHIDLGEARLLAIHTRA